MRFFNLALLALAIVVLASFAGELMWGDAVIWGSLEDDQIIWGTLGESADYVVWGN